MTYLCGCRCRNCRKTDKFGRLLQWVVGQAMLFRWIAWNRDHLAQHGISGEEAEAVVRDAKPPFPRKIEEEKWLVIGQGRSGRYLQVVYVTDPDKTVFIIHARPITDREKRRYRRRRKA